MSKLKLVNIQKSYKAGNTFIKVLKGISLEFRSNEFVSILGQSGSGKTTLLNIIGGLDRYDSGDLIINGKSTKELKDSDWDAYRNKSIGFVFQNYNLITHQSILQNVEIAMTLSGVSGTERKERARTALIEVGLGDHINKKPGQLSGGQMQRVAIARALVNNPDIILADEPTGALDSGTSVQVMEILRKISETRLVIMVTHNEELADEYSSRIIRLLDGEIQSDSHPFEEQERIANENEHKKEKKDKTSMSLYTATALSFKNLMTKKGRTTITAFAGSIGIIGVALVLALSNGLSQQIEGMQTDTLSGFPISVNTGEQNIEFGPDGLISNNNNEDIETEEFPDDDVIYPYDLEGNVTSHQNVLTSDYLDYVGEIQTELPNAVNAISYTRGVDINLLAKGEESVVNFNESANSSNNDAEEILRGNSNAYWQEMPNDEEFILSLYDLIGEESRLPSKENEIALVVDEYNRVDQTFFEKLGITEVDEKYHVTDLIGESFLKVIPNNDYYKKNENDTFTAAAPGDYEEIFNRDSGLELTITGVLRIKEDASSSYFSEGLFILQL